MQEHVTRKNHWWFNILFKRMIQTVLLHYICHSRFPDIGQGLLLKLIGDHSAMPFLIFLRHCDYSLLLQRSNFIFASSTRLFCKIAFLSPVKGPRIDLKNFAGTCHSHCLIFGYGPFYDLNQLSPQIFIEVPIAQVTFKT
jgi:hypothetical protein